ncbi:phBC6A51 family helix-turn-helix protein [Lentilactobacillus buchneri]|uniref:phBC6A51 family helix-turn-helix protein n=1 Tax=Lentilactobacillus buchneri TaxID=1581 RepID=UPI0028753532|nr:phBC6A51 family helix-turn-helix protein [Lentilactobacillus buchneri]MDS1015270.1 phBC6A51 family helix-turn-helix protein [Lentilactobacillus buchneri]
MAKEKIRDLATFYELPLKQRKAIMLMFPGNLTQEKIIADLQVASSTFYNWKTHEQFRKAQQEYNHYMLIDLTPEAIVTMRKLLNAKSEMVRFNAAKDILDRSMTGLEDAQRRKTVADAKIAESKLADLEDDKDDQMDALANMMSKLAKNVPKDDQNDD